MVHEAGIKIFHKVGSVRHALNVEKIGYDGIFAAGIEEGGHPLNDDVTTMVLTPRIAESVNIPVVATGGIADGRGLAAALCLGAEGVMMATRFINTRECQVHKNIQEEIIRRQEQDTTLICKSVNLQGRALKNDFTREILDLEAKGAAMDELFPFLTGQRVKKAWQNGDINYAAFMVGQSVGLIKDILSCQELLDTMIVDAERILKQQAAAFV